MIRKNNAASEDLEWVKRTQQGDHEAFSELVKKYQKRAYYLAFGMLGNGEDALDVTQEAFIKAFRAINSFRGTGGFYTWFYRIVYNLAIDFMRKEWRKKNLEYEDTRDHNKESLLSDSPSLTFHPGKETAQKELSKVIMDAIQSLPEQHRAVIVLREIDGLSYNEIAKSLRIRKGTVMSRLHYAREKLQEILTPYLKEGEVREK